MVNTIIIDDEPKAIESLKWELNSFCKDVNVVKTFTDPIKAIDYLKENTIDCIFLDVEMPNIDGLQFLKFFPERDFLVVFTTAYDQYALEALKEHAFDYLLKPIDSDDLIKTTVKVAQKVQSNKMELDIETRIKNIVSNSAAQKKINISVDGKIMFLEKDDIIYLKSDGNYCELYLENGKKHIITQKLKTFEDSLPTSHFVRVHNSYVVNIHKVKSYHKSDSMILLSNNKEIPVSRQRKAEVLDKLG